MDLPVFNSRVILEFFPSSFHIHGLRLLWVRTLATHSRWGLFRLLSCSYLPRQVPQMVLQRTGTMGTEPAVVGQGVLERKQGQCVSLPLSPLQLHLVGRATTHCFCWQHYCKLCVLKTTIFLCQAVLTGIFSLSLNSNSSLIALLPIIQNFSWFSYVPWDIKSYKPIFFGGGGETLGMSKTKNTKPVAQVQVAYACVSPIMGVVNGWPGPFLKVWPKPTMRQWRQLALLGSDAKDGLPESLTLCCFSLIYACSLSPWQRYSQSTVSGIPRVKTFLLLSEIIPLPRLALPLPHQAFKTTIYCKSDKSLCLQTPEDACHLPGQDR